MASKWGCVLVMVLGGVWGAGGQKLDFVCSRVDGTKGVCRDLRECINQGGSFESAPKLQLCSYTDFSRVIVCCRSSPTSIAQNKCFEWQQQRRKLGSSCTVVTKPLVHGGKEAGLGEFPHIVSLQEETPGMGRMHKCGGSLIAPDWVLTAAHCIKQTELLVRLGAHDLRETEEGVSFIVEVRSSTIHPHYKEPQRYNDIALLHLRFKVRVTDRIQPACLPHKGQRIRAGQKLVVAGWGKTGQAQGVSNVLQKAEVKAISRLKCARHPLLDIRSSATVSYPGGITDSIICLDEQDQGSCQGDSGGPLMYTPDDSCIQEVVGLVSRGVSECAGTTVPGLYTHVEYFLDWIVDTIWKEEL